MLLLTVISLAPAVLLMTTSFVRVIVVLGLLRQALGTQQAPPGQVITSITLFVTLLVMTPVWTKSYDTGIKPYIDGQLTLDEAFEATVTPIRLFMGRQIDRTGNEDDVWLFLTRLPEATDPDTGELRDNYVLDVEPNAKQRWVPLTALLPAFMLSELKTAFLDWLRDLPAVRDLGHRRGERDDLDGHADAAAGVGFAAISSCCSSCWSTAGRW